MPIGTMCNDSLALIGGSKLEIYCVSEKEGERQCECSCILSGKSYMYYSCSDRSLLYTHNKKDLQVVENIKL